MRRGGNFTQLKYLWHTSLAFPLISPLPLLVLCTHTHARLTHAHARTHAHTHTHTHVYVLCYFSSFRVSRRVNTTTTSFWLWLVVIGGSLGVAQTCPAQCTCSLAVVSCHEATMTAFPSALPSDMETLQIRGTYSQRSQFHHLSGSDLTGFTSLKVLTISHTLLDSIDEDAFQVRILSFYRLLYLFTLFHPGLSVVGSLTSDCYRHVICCLVVAYMYAYVYALFAVISHDI